MSFFKKSGIVNVKMVITEEKILSNIDKIQKMINPNAKKQIVQLEEDSVFKDLVESVKSYLIEYPKKKSFPQDVYKAAYELVEYATSQFEENTRKVEELIRKREKNIKLANILRDVLKAVKNKSKNWKEIVKKIKKRYPEEVTEALKTIGISENDEQIEAAEKIVNAKISNLEANMFIEIDMERIEDKSKALSYIGIEIAEALKYIPAPIQVVSEVSQIQSEKADVTDNKVEEKTQVSSTTTSELLQGAIIPEEIESEDEITEEAASFFEETRFDVRPSLWQRIKNSKFIRTVKYILQIRVVLDYPALPEGRGE